MASSFILIFEIVPMTLKDFKCFTFIWLLCLVYYETWSICKLLFTWLAIDEDYYVITTGKSL